MIHLFSLPLGHRQRKMLMPSGQGLISSDNLREALGLSLFCPLSRKGKTFSSAISVPLAKRAVRHRSIHVTAKPWPRPGMQGLSFIAHASLILKRQQLVTITSRQGGLDKNVKILAYIDG